jgi:hypothetical protein
MSKLDLLFTHLTDQCCSVFALFIEYLVYPRSNYYEVSADNIKQGLTRSPVLTRQMIEYCLKNILPYANILKMPELEYKERVDIALDSVSMKALIESKLSSKFKNEFSNLVNNSNWIEPYALNTFDRFLKKYFYYISFNGTIVEPDNIKGQLERSKNMFKQPIDSGFSYDTQNYIVMAFVWVLSGLVDWLEKSDIDMIDVNVMTRIILPSDKKIKDFTKPVKESKIEDFKFVEERLYESLLKHDLYPSSDTLDLLTTVFININNTKGVSEHVMEYSRTI